MMRLLVPSAFCLVLLTACGSNQPSSVDQQVRFAVQATLRAIPAATARPFPALPSPSTPTPATLSGLFCEYRFCIGHPPDMAFTDASALRNPAAPSNASYGQLATFNPGLYILVIWQDAPGVTDPQFMLDLVMQGVGDSRNGTVEAKAFGTINAFYVPITPTPQAASALPYGGAAAWLCGGRAFGWKAYTPQQELARSLLSDALGRFRCEQR